MLDQVLHVYYENSLDVTGVMLDFEFNLDFIWEKDSTLDRVFIYLFISSESGWF